MLGYRPEVNKLTISSWQTDLLSPSALLCSHSLVPAVPGGGEGGGGLVSPLGGVIRAWPSAAFTHEGLSFPSSGLIVPGERLD